MFGVVLLFLSLFPVFLVLEISAFLSHTVIDIFSKYLVFLFLILSHEVNETYLSLFLLPAYACCALWRPAHGQLFE